MVITLLALALITGASWWAANAVNHRDARHGLGLDVVKGSAPCGDDLEGSLPTDNSTSWTALDDHQLRRLINDLP